MNKKVSSRVMKFKNKYMLENFTFEVYEEHVEIQVGDNWGNKIGCTKEEARQVFKAVWDGKLQHPNKGKDTFTTINEVCRFVDTLR